MDILYFEYKTRFNHKIINKIFIYEEILNLNFASKILYKQPT